MVSTTIFATRGSAWSASARLIQLCARIALLAVATKPRRDRLDIGLSLHLSDKSNSRPLVRFTAETHSTTDPDALLLPVKQPVSNAVDGIATFQVCMCSMPAGYAFRPHRSLVENHVLDVTAFANHLGDVSRIFGRPCAIIPPRLADLRSRRFPDCNGGIHAGERARVSLGDQAGDDLRDWRQVRHIRGVGATASSERYVTGRKWFLPTSIRSRTASFKLFSLFDEQPEGSRTACDGLHHEDDAQQGKRHRGWAGLASSRHHIT